MSAFAAAAMSILASWLCWCTRWSQPGSLLGLTSWCRTPAAPRPVTVIVDPLVLPLQAPPTTHDASPRDTHAAPTDTRIDALFHGVGPHQTERRRSGDTPPRRRRLATANATHSRPRHHNSSTRLGRRTPRRLNDLDDQPHQQQQQLEGKYPTDYFRVGGGPPKKVAVCVCGQTRAFWYYHQRRHVWARAIASLGDPKDVDVYVYLDDTSVGYPRVHYNEKMRLAPLIAGELDAVAVTWDHGEKGNAWRELKARGANDAKCGLGEWTFPTAAQLKGCAKLFPPDAKYEYAVRVRTDSLLDRSLPPVSEWPRHTKDDSRNGTAWATELGGCGSSVPDPTGHTCVRDDLLLASGPGAVATLFHGVYDAVVNCDVGQTAVDEQSWRDLVCPDCVLGSILTDRGVEKRAMGIETSTYRNDHFALTHFFQDHEPDAMRCLDRPAPTTTLGAATSLLTTTTEQQPDDPSQQQQQRPDAAACDALCDDAAPDVSQEYCRTLLTSADRGVATMAPTMRDPL